MTKTYRFVSDYSVITFTVPGEADWSDEMWDSAAQSDLEDYVTNPEAYYQDDVFDTEEFLNV
jgi:hypothetical protein